MKMPKQRTFAGNKNAVRKILLFALFFSFFAGSASAQVNFRRDWDFFSARQAEYQTWLTSNSIGRFFRVESLQPTPKRLILRLLPTFTGDQACDSLRSAWKALRDQYFRDTRQDVHALLLEKLCFQMDLPLDSASILIHCPYSSYQVRIFGERSNDRLTPRFQESEDVNMDSSVFPIPMGPLKSVYNGGGVRLGKKDGDVPGPNLAQARQAVSDFFDRHYPSKGSDWLWKARIDTSSLQYNEFTGYIAHINGEILKERNFFEYHRVHVKIEQVSDLLDITWDFAAKYGRNPIYAPHTNSNDYHDFEISAFKIRFEDYQRALFKKLEAELKQL